MSTRLCSSGGSVEVVYSCRTIALITCICMLTKHVAKAALSTAECSSYYYIEHSLHWTQSLIASGGLLPSIICSGQGHLSYTLSKHTNRCNQRNSPAGVHYFNTPHSRRLSSLKRRTGAPLLLLLHYPLLHLLLLLLPLSRPLSVTSAEELVISRQIAPNTLKQGGWLRIAVKTAAEGPELEAKAKLPPLLLTRPKNLLLMQVPLNTLLRFS